MTAPLATVASTPIPCPRHASSSTAARHRSAGSPMHCVAWTPRRRACAPGR